MLKNELNISGLLYVNIGSSVSYVGCLGLGERKRDDQYT